MGKNAIIDDKNIIILYFIHQNGYDDVLNKGFVWFIRIHIEDRYQGSLR